MLYEFLIKVGDGPVITPSQWLDGDIIQVMSEVDSKKVWGQMLFRKRVTSAEYDAAQIVPGVFKWPWGRLDKKIHAPFIVDDSFTDSQITGYRSSRLDSKELITRRRNFKIDINSITYQPSGGGGRKTLSADSKLIITDPSITYEPRHDLPILKSEIITK